MDESFYTDMPRGAESCPTCGGPKADPGSGVCHCGVEMLNHPAWDNHSPVELVCENAFHSRQDPPGSPLDENHPPTCPVCDQGPFFGHCGGCGFERVAEQGGSPLSSVDELSTPLAQEGRPRFYWENGPFSHADLPQIAQDINERMSDEEVRLAILAINTTSTKSAAERRKDSPQHKAKKTREKDLLKAAKALLSSQGISQGDLTTAYLRSSANSTPQQELLKIQRAAQATREIIEDPAYTIIEPGLGEQAGITLAQKRANLEAVSGVALYCPVCDVEIEGTCAKCGYNGE